MSSAREKKLVAEAAPLLRELSQKALELGLRRTQDVCDALDLPAFVIGDEHNPDVMYGIWIGSRELAAALVAIEEGVVVAGMVQSRRATSNDNLH